MGPALLERLLGRLKVPVIFDFDDAIWTPYVSPANKYLSYLKFFGKPAVICRLSRHITVGNRYLAEFARRHNPNVSIIPSTIDTDLYRTDAPIGSGGGAVPIIGWTGSHSTVQHLDTLRPALLELRRRRPFRLRVIGTPRYALEGVDVEARSWRSETEVEDLREIDIGVMPLPDNEYVKGKCGMKLLQYMGLGIPTVASHVGANGDIVRDGEDGFLASTESDWVEKLSALLDDAALHARIGAAGRQTVEERFSARVWAPQVRALFEAVAAGRPWTDPHSVTEHDAARPELEAAENTDPVLYNS
jgi:glycosyltransferase involved in cell wall biosynthesis